MRRLWLLPLFIIITIYAYFHDIGSFGFIDPYETIAAGLPNSSIALNNLFNYLRAGTFFILGKNEFAGRIIQAILGIGLAFLTYFSAKYLTGGRKAAHIAMFITLTSPLCFTVSHISVPDIIFALSFTLAVFGYISAARDNDKKSGIIIFYLGMAFASLSAGFLWGTTAPLIILFSHVFVVCRRVMSVTTEADFLTPWKIIKNYFMTLKGIFFNIYSLIGIIIYALTVSPILLNNNYELNNIYFINMLIENLNYNKFLIYIIIILILIFPWNIFSGWALKSMKGNFTISRENAFLAVLWALIGFIAGFPNFAVCVPPISILISAAIIEEVIEYPLRSIIRPVIFYLSCVAAVLILIFNIQAVRKIAVTESHRDIANIALDYLKYESSVEIISYGQAMPGLSFYLNRDVENFNNKNNNNNDATATRNERRRLRRIWNGAKQVLLITRKRDAETFQSIIGREPVKVGESAGDILFTNY